MENKEPILYTVIYVKYHTVEEDKLIKREDCVTNEAAIALGHDHNIMTIVMENGPYSPAFAQGWARVMLQIFFRDMELYLAAQKGRNLFQRGETEGDRKDE